MSRDGKRRRDCAEERRRRKAVGMLGICVGRGQTGPAVRTVMAPLLWCLKTKMGNTLRLTRSVGK
jgi:hypothetical protein